MPSALQEARPHQGIAQRVPDSECRVPLVTATDSGVERIRRKPVLNGLINEYLHAAGHSKNYRSPAESYFRAGQGWWQADPAAAYVLVCYAAREVREIFSADQ
jgi:hypothetical protein